jgi:hypothetical protein
VAKLRQVDVLASMVASMANAIRQFGISELVCGTNCSTARSSVLYEKLRS